MNLKLISTRVWHVLDTRYQLLNFFLKKVDKTKNSLWFSKAHN